MSSQSDRAPRFPWDVVSCRCRDWCGDVPEGEDDPYAVCKGLQTPLRKPDVELVVDYWPNRELGYGGR